MIAKKNYLHIYVFSFNRSVFLKNCLRSIATFAPECSATIVDDGSDDPATKKVLAEAANLHRIVRPQPMVATEFKTGGLYFNMNYAFEDARKQGLRFVLFIQDDMQFVRKISEEDVKNIEQYFDNTPNSFQLHTCFFKEAYRKYDEKRMTPDATNTFYIREKFAGPGNRGFSAVGIFDTRRFFETLGQLEVGEGRNERKVLQSDFLMGFYAYPFMAWLPYPIAYRGKTRRLSHRIVDFLAGSGFHPIQYMPPDEHAAFLSRPLTKLPVAERFLVAPSAPKAKLWGPGGIENIEYRGGWRKTLGFWLLRVEAALVRRYKKWVE